MELDDKALYCVIRPFSKIILNDQYSEWPRMIYKKIKDGQENKQMVSKGDLRTIFKIESKQIWKNRRLQVSGQVETMEKKFANAIINVWADDCYIFKLDELPALKKKWEKEDYDKERRELEKLLKAKKEIEEEQNAKNN